MDGNAKTDQENILTNPDANPAKALLIPKMKHMPVSTMENILKLAESGAKIIFRSKPEAAPGFLAMEESGNQINELWNQLDLREAGQEKICGKGKIILSGDFGKTLEKEGIYREELVDSGLKFVRRSHNGDSFYFLVNHGPNIIDQQIALSSTAKTILVMDPLTSKIGKTNSTQNENQTAFRIRMEPGETLILRTTNLENPNLQDWNFIDKPTDQFEITGLWQLTFDDNGGPETPEDAVLENIAPWTTLEDPNWFVIHFCLKVI